MAIALARHFSCDIISCDSRQFFKEMAIGTAVPSEEELQAAPHHFIQNKSISELYTVGDYEREALPLLDRLFKQNPVQVLVGGSGLYVDAVLRGFDTFPLVPDHLRVSVEELYEKDGISGLKSVLKQHDPEYYQKLENENPQTLVNPQRMKRFVSVCLAEGKPYSSYINQTSVTRNFTPVLIGLEAQRDEMYKRINQRVDIMLANGLLNEAERLHPYKQLNALQTVGYRELFSFLEGDISFDFAVEEIKKNTRRFAKRQLTWFKRNDAIVWFDYKTPLNTIITYIKTQLS